MSESMKHIKKGGCQSCIKYHLCAALDPDEECFRDKKTASMEEKIAQREAVAAWRKKVAKEMAKLYNH